jgi:hemoglobin
VLPLHLGSHSQLPPTDPAASTRHAEAPPPGRVPLRSLVSAAVYIRSMPTLFEHAGGEEALHRLEQIFYDSVLADPLLRPLFGAGRPSHVDHLTAFTAESFGGPDRFSRELGFAHLISVHRGLRITEAQRKRFVELYMAALDAAGMPSDAAFREAVRRVRLRGGNAELPRRERRRTAPSARSPPLDVGWRRRGDVTRHG